ncbi:MAG: SlyX family protein [Gammaproteobacteria bacterium]|nr:SlyX family protein [Gammaproteobacteria bacterium]
MNEHIVELESRLAFMEDAIHGLNKTVVLQQNAMQVLQQELESLREQLVSLSPSPLATGEVEPPPPHY